VPAVAPVLVACVAVMLYASGPVSLPSLMTSASVPPPPLTVTGPRSAPSHRPNPALIVSSPRWPPIVTVLPGIIASRSTVSAPSLAWKSVDSIELVTTSAASLCEMNVIVSRYSAPLLWPSSL
jgi:hypothetical protein